VDFTSGLLQRAFQCEDHKPGYIGRGIAFVDWIRDEEKFHAVGELVVRMKYDARQARAALKRAGDAFPPLL
jgi:hypothetical protein